MLKERLLTVVKKDLECTGFVYGDGIKYGLDLLIYTDEISKVHSKYGLVIFEKEMTYREIIAYQRICNSVNKILLLAVYDKGEMTYVTVERFLPKGVKST